MAAAMRWSEERGREQGREQERLRQRSSVNHYAENHGGNTTTGDEEAGARRALPRHPGSEDPNSAEGGVDERHRPQGQEHRPPQYQHGFAAGTYQIRSRSVVAAWNIQRTKGKEEDVRQDFNMFRGQMDSLFVQEECDDALKNTRPIKVGDKNLRPADLHVIFGVPAVEKA
ncbi:unnamed protein product, partial [Pylaiella littoralis]